MTSSEAVRLGEEAARRLARSGRYEIGPGLTSAEFARIERDFDFEFADDHRAFLAAGLPLNVPPPDPPWGMRWPDWRNGPAGDLHDQLGWPVEGLLLKAERHGLWLPSWGQRPADDGQALSTARLRLSRAPKMVPVYGHRYLPAGRGAHGHPVLSMWATDIVIYGTDLADYINHEFVDPEAPVNPNWTPRPMVPFWSEFLRPQDLPALT